MGENGNGVANLNGTGGNRLVQLLDQTTPADLQALEKEIDVLRKRLDMLLLARRLGRLKLGIRDGAYANRKYTAGKKEQRVKDIAVYLDVHGPTKCGVLSVELSIPTGTVTTLVGNEKLFRRGKDGIELTGEGKQLAQRVK